MSGRSVHRCTALCRSLYGSEINELHLVMEDIYFGRFYRACLSGDPKEALNSLLVWLGYCSTQQQGVAMQELVNQLYDDELAEQIVVLREAVALHSTEWSGSHLYHAVARARRRLLNR